MVIRILLIVAAAGFIFRGGIHAQELGFGCLGLVGGFGGYTTQSIQAVEVNDFITEFNRSKGDSLAQSMGSFNNLSGFRIGLNIFRQNFEGLVFTFKAYYENLIQRRTGSVHVGGTQENSFTEIALKNFGLGFDIGTPINRFISWKVLDASLIFHRVRFTSSLQDASGAILMNQYSAVESPVGYTLGTGFIMDLVDQYVTLEGSAGYMFVHVRRMQTSDGKLLTDRPDGTIILENLINSGGFNASIQVNIGVPL